MQGSLAPLLNKLYSLIFLVNFIGIFCSNAVLIYILWTFGVLFFPVQHSILATIRAEPQLYFNVSLKIDLGKSNIFQQKKNEGPPATTTTFKKKHLLVPEKMICESMRQILSMNQMIVGKKLSKRKLGDVICVDNSNQALFMKKRNCLQPNQMITEVIAAAYCLLFFKYIGRT